MIARFAIACLLACALPAAADMYKWVDEKGVTHYSESPPPEGQAAKKLELPTTAPSAARPESPEDWKTRELEFRQRRLKKERAEEAEKQKSEHDAANVKERCERARNKLDILQGGHGIYHLDEHGNRVFMDDNQRETEILRWRADVKKYCEP
jgi:hypothetical protein